MSAGWNELAADLREAAEAIEEEAPLIDELASATRGYIAAREAGRDATEEYRRLKAIAEKLLTPAST